VPYVGYKLTPLARGRLLKAFPPHYENVVAHHVTTDFLGNRQTAFRPPSGKITVIGHAHDPERGIHAAVVRVGDLTHQGMEPDKLLHITISHRKGARPVHSNDAIKKGWKPVEPFEIEGEPFLGEAVFRVDPEGTSIDHSQLRRYFHSPDWTQSGAAPEGMRTPRGMQASTGLFAGRNKRYVAPYAVPRDVPWVRYFHAKTGRPTVAFSKDDEPRIKAHRAVLSKYKGSRFKELPSGERFSSDPGDPVKQKEIGKPVRFLRKRGYDVKFVSDLRAHHQKAQAKHHEVESEGSMFSEGRDRAAALIRQALTEYNPESC
jgi:hypothetical protein